jgi:hypothetical protein
MFRNSSVKGLVAGAGALAALVAPVALAAPAQAQTNWDGCTITPTVPTSAFTSTGQKVINYRGGVFCPLGKTARVERQRWEEDSVSREGEDVDDFTGSISSVVVTPLWWDQHPVPNMDTAAGDDYEEVYQKVRIQVTTGSSTSAWSPWELTSVVWIHQ